jgi:DNA-binding transcriptional regulator GbsR (MarR family)
MAEKITLTKEQVLLIEEYARVQEMLGMQPSLAKVVALLNIADDVELTFDQIQDTLGLSKSGTSQAINQLLATKRIEYKTRIGDRKRYFFIPISEWKQQVMQQFNGVAALAALNKKILAVRSTKTKEFNKNLKEMTDFLADMQKVLKQTLEEKR